MNNSLGLMRVLFLILCALFSTAYATTILGYSAQSAIIGLASGILFGICVISLEMLFSRFNLRSFNLATLGMLFGFLMGQTIWLVLQTAIDLGSLQLSTHTIGLIKLGIFLFSIYLGMSLVTKTADELYMSIPFVKFKPSYQKKKDIILDVSILTDPRIIDLATSGLLDHHLIMPCFALKELYQMADSTDETIKAKARKSLEVVKKLESIPNLEMRYIDTDFSDIKDVHSKLTSLARHLDGNIITADINRVQQSEIEGVRVININFLSNALKPITATGEFLNLKIQRYGKEPRQGIGYLDDGTMVVVNGGAEFIGDIIRTQVLSVKHTSSGRMIFCNAAEDSILTDQELQQSIKTLENTHKNYFAL